MNHQVEILVTAMIVGGSALALVRRFLRFIGSADADGSGCGTSCGSCEHNSNRLRQETFETMVELQFPRNESKELD